MHLVYKNGIWCTKLAFRLQICSFQFTNKHLALQTGISDYNSANCIIKQHKKPRELYLYKAFISLEKGYFYYFICSKQRNPLETSYTTLVANWQAGSQGAPRAISAAFTGSLLVGIIPNPYEQNLRFWLRVPYGTFSL